MDETDSDRDDPTFSTTAGEAEINELLGLFDLPAFVRRGQDLEYALARLHARCRRERAGLLDMVRLRLKQWAAAATGPDDWRAAFAAPIEELWALSGAETPAWAGRPASPRHQRTVARDLATSVARFNRRWTRFLDELPLEPINRMIDHYNRYYLLEKECCLGSARLAARNYSPKLPLSTEALLAHHPTLPVPELLGS